MKKILHVDIPNTTMTGAGLYDGWWSNDISYTLRMPNATQGPVVSEKSPGKIWLFDLANDPNEEANVAADYPGVVDAMQARLAELADPKNGYRDPQNNLPIVRGIPALH